MCSRLNCARSCDSRMRNGTTTVPRGQNEEAAKEESERASERRRVLVEIGVRQFGHSRDGDALSCPREWRRTFGSLGTPDFAGRDNGKFSEIEMEDSFKSAVFPAWPLGQCECREASWPSSHDARVECQVDHPGIYWQSLVEMWSGDSTETWRSTDSEEKSR